MTIATVEQLLELLERSAHEDDGEGVDLLAHALQCATNLARAEPDDTELQLAGLVHDLGTVLEPGRPAAHARTGAEAVRGLLGARIADLVEQHDQTKRYLVTAEPRYREHLSPQSVATLAAQGGLLDDTARAAFEARPDFATCLVLRRADDAAKIPGTTTPSLDSWRAALDHQAAVVRQR